MSKKSKKKKKKISAKAIKYAKFKKDKPANVTFVPPDLTPEQVKWRQEDEKNINFYTRSNRNPPTKEVNERRMKSKR